LGLKVFARIATLLLGSTLSAYAADMSVSPPDPVEAPAPVYDWTGFYVGANGGFGWANAGSLTINDPINGAYTIGAKRGSGFLGGGQVGYNLQSDVFVSSIEADAQYANMGSSANWGPYAFLGVNSGSRAEYFGTVRLRTGFAVDRTLLFLTGGLAYGGFNSAPLGGGVTLNIGYAVGVGAEYAFSDHWTGKVEALYININKGDAKTTTVVNGGTIYPISAVAGNGGSLVRVGVNYKF
jgi:outer membrane immunogenic protein